MGFFLTTLIVLCRLLCEVHEEYETNIKLARQGYFVYDFALPLLVLHAFTFHTGQNIAEWLRICPRRQITVLDTHDGMGIDDISGLASVGCLPTLAPCFLVWRHFLKFYCVHSYSFQQMPLRPLFDVTFQSSTISIHTQFSRCWLAGCTSLLPWGYMTLLEMHG